MSGALRRDHYGVLPNMTYAQWEASKRGAEGKMISPIRAKDMQGWRKSLQNQQNVAILKEKIERSEISTKLRSQQQKNTLKEHRSLSNIKPAALQQERRRKVS